MKPTLSTTLLQTQGYSLEGAYKLIEVAGRLCYQSSPKDGVSSKAFCDKLIAMGHLSPLEHGTIYLKLPGLGIDAKLAKQFYERNKFSKVSYSNDETLVSTNMRVIVENDRSNDLQFITNDEQILRTNQRKSFIITTTRGIANELVRHRAFSFSQSSTRYSMQLRKNNVIDIECILPSYMNEDSKMWGTLCRSYETAEKAYKELLNMGASPQVARDVLPLGLSSQIMMTGFVSDWNSFLALRTSSNAHPEMQYVANSIKSLLQYIKLIDGES